MTIKQAFSRSSRAKEDMYKILIVKNLNQIHLSFISPFYYIEKKVLMSSVGTLEILGTDEFTDVCKRALQQAQHAMKDMAYIQNTANWKIMWKHTWISYWVRDNEKEFLFKLHNVYLGKGTENIDIAVADWEYEIEPLELL